jgi:hypothetical protein
MKRPKIKDFFPGKTLMEMHDLYVNHNEWYNYMQALDSFIDYLINKKRFMKQEREKK